MEVEKGVKGELKDVRGEDESGTRGVIPVGGTIGDGAQTATYV